MERIFDKTNKAILVMIVALCIISITPISYGAKKSKAIKVTKIEIFDNKKEIFKGQKTITRAVASPVNATNKKIKWTSSDKKVATINSKGEISAKKVGTTTITATATDGSNIKASYKLSVIEDKRNVKIVGNHIMTVGEMQGLRIDYDQSLNRDFKWKSSKPSVATVDKNGVVKAKKNGTTIITAKSKYGTAEASFTIGVNNRY